MKHSEDSWSCFFLLPLSLLSLPPSQVKGGFGPLNTLAWFPNGKGFVTGGEDGYVRVHNLDSDYTTSRKYD